MEITKISLFRIKIWGNNVDMRGEKTKKCRELNVKYTRKRTEKRPSNCKEVGEYNGRRNYYTRNENFTKMKENLSCYNIHDQNKRPEFSLLTWRVKHEEELEKERTNGIYLGYFNPIVFNLIKVFPKAFSSLVLSLSHASRLLLPYFFPRSWVVQSAQTAALVVYIVMTTWLRPILLFHFPLRGITRLVWLWRCQILGTRHD